jgi:hypothetical protein
MDLNHYAPKAAITASIVTGESVTALCGETFVAEAQGGGSTSADELQICAMCALIYNDPAALAASVTTKEMQS